MFPKLLLAELDYLFWLEQREWGGHDFTFLFLIISPFSSPTRPAAVAIRYRLTPGRVYIENRSRWLLKYATERYLTPSHKQEAAPSAACRQAAPGPGVSSRCRVPSAGAAPRHRSSADSPELGGGGGCKAQAQPHRRLFIIFKFI